MYEFFWTSRVYNLGEQYRRLLSWPKILPLPIYTDHGFDLRNEFSAHEHDNDSLVHVTWHKHKYRGRFNTIKSKAVFLIEHPYYEKLTSLRNQQEHRIGTVVFLPHSNEKIRLVDNYDMIRYIDDIEKKLTDQFLPITFCISHHDVANGLKDFILARKNINIVCMGNGTDSSFFRNLYELLKAHKYATSPYGNTELFCSVASGVKFFTYGKMLKYNAIEGIEIGPIQQNRIVSDVDKKKFDLFRFENLNYPGIEKDQLQYVSEMMAQGYKPTVFLYLSMILNFTYLTPKRLLQKLRCYFR